jgi:hypothetical protein
MSRLENVDTKALADVLEKARVQLDESLSHFHGAEALDVAGLRRLMGALSDNNSTCNTACACHAPADIVQQR